MKAVCFLFDPNVGGPHVRARSVYEILQRDGHEVRIAIPKGEGTAESYHRTAGLPVDRIQIRKPVAPTRLKIFVRYLLSFPWGALRVSRYLREQRPDVVHVNGAFDLVPALGAKIARVPLVWHLNDTAMPHAISRILGVIVRVLATQVVAAAANVATHYGLKQAQVTTLYAPVDTNKFEAREPRPPKQPAVIGLVANWNPLKGQDRFVEVVDELTHRGHVVKAVLVGRFSEVQRGFWEPIHERIDAYGLTDRVSIVGYSDDIPATLAAWDVALLTSRSEACPMSVLEAMAVGVPQVCFQVGGVDELLGTAEINPVGLSVPEGDTDGMVEAVERILCAPQRYMDMSKAGPGRARGRFSLEACVQGHLAVYQAAIRGKEHVS